MASCKEDVWYVDSGASNHMTSHGEWFKVMKDPKKPGYVETGDDTTHPIAHVGDVPLSMQDGKVKYLADVLHVPQITKIWFLSVKWLSRVCKCGSIKIVVLLKTLKTSASWLPKAKD